MKDCLLVLAAAAVMLAAYPAMRLLDAWLTQCERSMDDEQRKA